MTLVLDAGALIALERRDRALMAAIKLVRRTGEAPLTHAGVVGQVWRGRPDQAELARALKALEIVALDEALARKAGVLLHLAQMSDVVDAALVGITRDDDTIYTSDDGDIVRLAEAADLHVDVVHR